MPVNILQGIIRGKVQINSVINTDGWKGYNGLVDISYQKHYRVHNNNELANKRSHINDIESFWGYVILYWFTKYLYFVFSIHNKLSLYYIYRCFLL